MKSESLEKIANKLRYDIIKNSHRSKTPHLGSCLSCVEILVTLYWQILRLNENNITSLNRDRFILSKGHAAPALYHVLAMKGFFPKILLESYGNDGSLLGEHPVAPGILNGVEAATGSLGHGLSIGVGMAMACRIKKQEFQTFVLMSDGECNEGAIWEAAMFSSAQKLHNITVIIDYNKWQATDRSNEVLQLEPLSKKWDSFGWDVREINGHSFDEIFQNLTFNSHTSKKPKVIIANTVKGKGISFMEDDNNWHYRIPTEKELKEAQKELGIDTLIG